MGVPEIFIWEATAQEVWGPKPPVRSRGEAPVRDLGDVCQQLKQFAYIVYRFCPQKR